MQHMHLRKHMQSHLWRFEGVVCGKVNGQEKYPTLVRTVILQGKEKRINIK